MVNKIDNEGYCIDCTSNHNCSGCPNMNPFVKKYIISYNKRLSEVTNNELEKVCDDPYDSKKKGFEEDKRHFNR